LFDKEKKEVGTIELKDSVFSVPFEGKEVLVTEVVKMYLASRRQGTHSTKTYATISGGNSKPWRQKGTGRARRGTLRASTLRGGAPAFGPQPRDYSYKVPKKKIKGALKVVLSERLNNNKLFVVKSFDFEAPKTKNAISVLQKTWNIENAIIIGGPDEKNFILSVRNLKGYTYVPFNNIEVYTLLAHKNVMLTEEAVKYLNEVMDWWKNLNITTL